MSHISISISSPAISKYFPKPTHINKLYTYLHTYGLNQMDNTPQSLSLPLSWECYPLKAVYCDNIKVNKACKYMYVPIIMEPLLAGERKPMAENTIRKKAHMISCTPVPTRT